MKLGTEVDPLTGLNVVNGTNLIAEPGKFEMQARYVPEFYNSFLDGFATEHSDGSFSIQVNAGDKAKYPELKRRKTVRMVVTEQGFVEEI